METAATKEKQTWRVIVVGGHTRSIGKTELVCDVIRAFPEENWIAGKITQYGHGVCAKNGENCGCAPDEHSYAISWEKDATTRNRQLAVPGGGCQELFLAADQARLSGRGFAAPARSAVRGRAGCQCSGPGRADAYHRKQFAAPVCTAEPLFRGDGPGPRGFQGLGASRSGPRGRIGLA